MQPQLKRYTAFPEDPYRPFKIRKNREWQESWVAPEHRRDAAAMQRAFPLDKDGLPMKHLGKELVLDPRPSIMKPERKPFFLGLEQGA